MKAPFRRLPLAISLTAILTLALTGIVAANPISKTIDTQTCTSNTAEQCATYGPFGFTGTITFAADEVGTTVLLLDVICVNPVLAGGSFNTVGISGGTATGSTGSSTTYHLTLGGSTTGSYTLPSGQDCSDGKYNPFGDASGVSFFVSSATVSYSILLDGVTAANANSVFGDKGVNFNSMLNKIYEPADNATGVVTANSPSVGPPEGPQPEIPESPLAVLLLGTGGLTSVWYVSRKLRQSASLTAA